MFHILQEVTSMRGPCSTSPLHQLQHSRTVHTHACTCSSPHQPTTSHAHTYTIRTCRCMCTHTHTHTIQRAYKPVGAAAINTGRHRCTPTRTTKYQPVQECGSSGLLLYPFASMQTDHSSDSKLGLGKDSLHHCLCPIYSM